MNTKNIPLDEKRKRRLLENFRRRLLSTPGGPFAPRVHQLTLHGYTYPFVERYWEAALPDPPPGEITGGRSRRHSMLGAALLARPEDLLFFFQADPQDPRVKSRRGIRGVYSVAGTISWAPITAPLSHPVHEEQYKMHPACPKCGSRFATLYDPCPECRTPLPTSPYMRRPDKPLPEHVLSLRIPLRPATVFAQEVSDERAYGDLSYNDLVRRVIVWIGRHDNAMGAGKGSSVRQLLPEEALKLYGLLLTEPNQSLVRLAPPPTKSAGVPILNADGTPLECVAITGNEVSEELALHTVTSLMANDPGSTLYREIASAVPDLEELWATHYLEYTSSEFPWGYTGATSDYVCVFRPRDGAPIRKVVLLEFKRGAVGIKDVAQAWLYMPWVGQLLGMHLGELVDSPQDAVEVHLTPVLVGSRLVQRGANAIRCLPESYTRTVRYYNGSTVKHVVNKPVLWRYVLKPCPKPPRTERARVEFLNINTWGRTVNYVPPVGTPTTETERRRATEELVRRCRERSQLASPPLLE